MLLVLCREGRTGGRFENLWTGCQRFDWSVAVEREPETPRRPPWSAAAELGRHRRRASRAAGPATAVLSRALLLSISRRHSKPTLWSGPLAFPNFRLFQRASGSPENSAPRLKKPRLETQSGRPKPRLKKTHGGGSPGAEIRSRVCHAFKERHCSNPPTGFQDRFCEPALSTGARDCTRSETGPSKAIAAEGVRVGGGGTGS